MRFNHFYRNFIRHFFPAEPFYMGRGKKIITSSSSPGFAWANSRSTLPAAIIPDSLSDDLRIRRLIDKLQSADISASDKLLAYIQNLHQLFRSFAFSEPATAGYYYSLLGSLKGFYLLVESFQQLQKEFLKTLDDVLLLKKKERDTICFCQVQAGRVLNKFPALVNQLLRYNGHFRNLISNESKDQAGIAVIKRGEQLLLHLINYTDDLLITTESTQASATAWLSFLDKIEWQEVYN